MRTPEHILIPHDFSTCSRQALAYAMDLAAHTGAELHILHVEVIHSDSMLPEDSSKTKAQILHEHLKKELQQCAAEDHLYVSDLNSIRYIVLRNVSAAAAITQYCEEYGIDLVVMGTHGRKGLSRNLLGSVAEEVVRMSPTTVLTIREKEDIGPLTDHLNRIMVPVDFSDYSRDALYYAKEIAALFGASLDLVHVIEERLHPAFYNTGVFSVYDIEPGIETKLLDELKSFYKSVDGPDREASYTVLYGNPSKEILHRLATEDTDMLILSTHGLTGVKRMLLGSVAEKLVREAPCPVITLKGTEPALKSISPWYSRHEKAPA